QTLLERIHAQIRQLNDSLTQYLGYSRLSEMQPAPVNLALRLQDLVLDMQVKFASQQIKLNFRPPAEKLEVFGDWLQLQRIFMNLLDNAADAIGREGIIELRLRRRGKRVLVSFSDNGCGMTPAEKRRIYTPYFSTKPSGTGLGLFVVREIVRAHRGRITCVTRPGQGTRFTLSFPQYPVAHMAEDR
ncbi:MAG: HAMP domain-containing histidine kinase, partial [Calditrichaeota bacterium]|nr:HAMP domain-containing histidine kinase [Calditrichota bacterium]